MSLNRGLNVSGDGRDSIRRNLISPGAPALTRLGSINTVSKLKSNSRVTLDNSNANAASPRTLISSLKWSRAEDTESICNKDDAISGVKRNYVVQCGCDVCLVLSMSIHFLCDTVFPIFFVLIFCSIICMCKSRIFI